MAAGSYLWAGACGSGGVCHLDTRVWAQCWEGCGTHAGVLGYTATGQGKAMLLIMSCSSRWFGCESVRIALVALRNGSVRTSVQREVRVFFVICSSNSSSRSRSSG